MNHDEMTPLAAWMKSLSVDGDVLYISEPRKYAHDESQYDQQYTIDQACMSVGRGLVTLLREQQVDFSGAALEVGCGTGFATLGLVAEQAYPQVLITDSSTAFVEITRNKLANASINVDRVLFGTLLAEDLHLLPPNVFSLIMLRATLHHVLDVEKFIAQSARALKPGGALVFQEPCMEGYVVMGAMAQFLPLAVQSAGKHLSEAQREKVQLFIDTMKFYARRDVDKSQAEDKHLFRVDEVMKIGAAAGLAVDFFANRTFEHFDVPIESRHPSGRFSNFYRDYVKYCMSWDNELMQLFDETFMKYCRFLDEVSSNCANPYTDGVFVCRKV